MGESISSAKKEKYLKVAFHLLKRERKMYHVTEVLRQLISCKEDQKSCEEEKRAYEAICAVESYSRIEKGKRFPNRNNYRKLSDKLEIDAKYIVELLNTQSYQAICLRKEIDEAVFYEQYEKAKKLLRSLEELLDTMGEKENNLQYLECRFLNCRNRVKKEKDIVEIAEKILCYTLSLKSVGKGEHCYTRVELDLIHIIAAEYQKRKEYEKAHKLLKNILYDLERGMVNMEERFRETYLVALNLDKALTDMERYEEGNEYCIKWGKMAVQRGWASLLDDYLVEISYNLKNIGASCIL